MKLGWVVAWRWWAVGVGFPVNAIIALHVGPLMVWLQREPRINAVVYIRGESKGNT